MANESPQLSLSAQNSAIRQILMSRNPQKTVKLGSQTITGGTTIFIDAADTGLTTGFWLHFSISYTVATAAMVLNQFAMGAFFPGIRVYAPDGSQLHNLNGTQLFMILSRMTPNPVFGYVPMISTRTDSSVLNGHVRGGASLESIGLSVGAQNAQVSVYIPIARNVFAGDLTGIIDSYIANSKIRIEIDTHSNSSIASSSQDDTKPFNSATGTISGLTYTVSPEQEIIEALDGVRPILDIATNYKLEGSIVYTDLSASGEKIVPYPSDRVITGHLIYLIHGGYIAGTASNDIANITRFQAIKDGSNVVFDRTLVSQEIRQRMAFNDLPHGFFYFDHSQAPIKVNNAASYQHRYTMPSTLNSLPRLFTLYQSITSRGGIIANQIA
jgi:hypothetical protein